MARVPRGVINIIRSCFSTGPQQQHGTFYEFRTYTVKPDKTSAFLQLTNAKAHLRKHSELLGYWSVEFGGLNKFFHIWKYDSFEQRAGVRTALARDSLWIDEYITKVMPMLSKQENEVTYLVPWCKIENPPAKGVYELITFQMKVGGPSVWGKAFQAAVSSHACTGYSHLVGVFHTEYGLLNRVHVLWWYESADQRAATRHVAHGDARVVAAVRQSTAFLESQRNMLLLPTSFSPLQ